MSRTSYLVIALAALALMEGVAWTVWKSSKEAPAHQPRADEESVRKETSQDQSSPATHLSEVSNPSSSGTEDADSESFPPPTTEAKNGRTERTIHMGVRQYAWDPPIIKAKQGELVRLIVHNADVQHGLVIPELNVLNIDIPPDGAVIEFVPDKVGTFVFFCSYYCGDGHSEMRGKIIIE